VTFTEEFSALEQKSLNQIIAAKTHKELSELRSRVDTPPTIPKRWVWKLIQNAKDVHVGGKVAVRIEADLEDPDARHLQAHRGRSLLRTSVSLTKNRGEGELDELLQWQRASLYFGQQDSALRG
jgi:hypothetical protein